MFAERYIAVEFATETSFKTKQRLRSLITDNGGIVSFSITRKVSSYCVTLSPLADIISLALIIIIIKSIYTRRLKAKSH